MAIKPVEIREDEPENQQALSRKLNTSIHELNEMMEALTPEPPAPESLPAKIATVWLAWTALVVIVIGLAAVLIG